MIDLSVDVSSSVPADLEDLAGTLFNEIVRDAIHPYLDEVKQAARSNHRFESRTGNLERAIKNNKTADGGSVYVDESIAPYGKYVHDGHRSWAADNFIEDNFDEDRLNDMIEHVIDRELK